MPSDGVPSRSNATDVASIVDVAVDEPGRLAAREGVDRGLRLRRVDAAEAGRRRRRRPDAGRVLRDVPAERGGAAEARRGRRAARSTMRAMPCVG